MRHTTKAHREMPCAQLVLGGGRGQGRHLAEERHRAYLSDAPLGRNGAGTGQITMFESNDTRRRQVQGDRRLEAADACRPSMNPRGIVQIWNGILVRTSR